MKSILKGVARPGQVYSGIALKLAAEVAGRICQLGFIVLVARSVGVGGFGFYSLAVAWGYVAGQFADGGLHLLTNREEVNSRGSFAPVAFPAKFWATGISFAALGLVAPVYSNNLQEIVVFWAISFSFVIYSLAEFGFSLLRARGQLAQEALLIMSNRILLPGLGLLLVVVLGWGLAGVALSHLLCSTITTFFTFRRIKASKFWAKTGPGSVFTVWKRSFPLGLGLLLSLLAFRVDVLLLAQFRSGSEVGQYSAAYRLFEPVLMLPAALLAGLFPFLVKLAPDPTGFARFSRTLVVRLVVAGVGVAVMLALLSQWLVGWLYGADYRASAGLLIMLAGAIPFMYANYGLTHILIALQRERANTFFFGIALATNLALNLALIPLWGGVAAALTTILTEAVLSGLCLVNLRYRTAQRLQTQTVEV